MSILIILVLIYFVIVVKIVVDSVREGKIVVEKFFYFVIGNYFNLIVNIYCNKIVKINDGIDIVIIEIIVVV